MELVPWHRVHCLQSLSTSLAMLTQYASLHNLCSVLSTPTSPALRASWQRCRICWRRDCSNTGTCNCVPCWCRFCKQYYPRLPTRTTTGGIYLTVKISISGHWVSLKPEIMLGKFPSQLGQSSALIEAVVVLHCWRSLLVQMEQVCALNYDEKVLPIL